MKSFVKSIIFFCLVFCTLVGVQIETFYGPIEVEEPVLLELIESPAFQRLKSIHQYGVAYYTTHNEEFTRYEHSLGVFALLQAQGCTLEEQIAGLLHDVSHTIFSHVGDWIFNRQHQEVDYQNLTHADYLERSGLGIILGKYGYSIDQIQPKYESFPALEQSLPNLCADRLDYNLQGAYYQGYISHEEAVRMFHTIKLIEGHWISEDYLLLKKLVRYSIYMSQNCWGSGTEYILSMWLAEAILHGVDIGMITIDDIRFGIDQEIWDRLLASDDILIQQNMHKILHHADYITFVDTSEADIIVKSKYRGIDPWVVIDGKRVRLTATDPQLAEEYRIGKERMAQGWAIKFSQP